jgi:hypothetical protein
VILPHANQDNIIEALAYLKNNKNNNNNNNNNNNLKYLCMFNLRYYILPLPNIRTVRTLKEISLVARKHP